VLFWRDLMGLEHVQIAEEAPKFFRRHMDPLVQMAIREF
jgi:hypothetical protein